MKKWLFPLTLMLLLVPVLAQAQINWYSANQATIAWDPVTQLANGSPVPAGSTIQYLLYSKTATNPTPKQEGQPTPAPTAVITFADEGQYLVGIRAQRLVNGVVVAESAISWSDDPAVVQSGPFDVQYYFAPMNVFNIRRQ
jgi:hypothetical protein